MLLIIDLHCIRKGEETEGGRGMHVMGVAHMRRMTLASRTKKSADGDSLSSFSTDMSIKSKDRFCDTVL